MYRKPGEVEPDLPPKKKPMWNRIKEWCDEWGPQIGVIVGAVAIVCIFMAVFVSTSGQQKFREETCLRFCQNKTIVLCQEAEDKLLGQDIIISVCREPEGYSMHTQEAK